MSESYDDKEETWQEILSSSASYHDGLQARMFKKLGQTIKNAQKTADVFNERIFWLTVVGVILTLVQVVSIFRH